MYFWVSGKVTRDKVILYNNVGLISYGAEVIASEIPENRRFQLLHSFDASSPTNLREYPHKFYIAINYSHCATSSPLIVWVHLQNFHGGLRKTHVLKPHPRSLILAPTWATESAYATSYWSSIVGPILPCLRHIAGFLFRTATPLPLHPNY